MEVHIVVFQEVPHYEYRGRSMTQTYMGTKKLEQSRQYVNLDIVKDDIRREEVEKVEAVISEKDKTIEDIRSKLHTSNTNLSETKSKLDIMTKAHGYLNTKNTQLETSNMEFEDNLKKAQTLIEEQASELAKIKLAYRDLEHKKGFWGWL